MNERGHGPLPKSKFSALRLPETKHDRFGRAPPRMVTKGNKIFAETAGIREVEGSRAKNHRAFIYLPQRGIEAVLGVVRDTGFEPVTSCV